MWLYDFGEFFRIPKGVSRDVGAIILRLTLSSFPVVSSHLDLALLAAVADLM